MSSSLGPSPSSTVCRDAPPPPSPLKAIGKFHHLIQTGQVQTAFDTMVVHMLLPMFLKVGEAPNVSTTTCCAWIFDQVTSPMIEILRCEGEGRDISEALLHGLALVQSCIGAARRSFQGDPQLAHVSLFFESLGVLMESAQSEVSDGGLAHTPSALRAALEQVRSTFGPDSALGLAFEHGVLGQALLEASSRLIASNAQDAAASDKFSKAQALVAKLSDASGGQDCGGEEVIDLAAIDEVVRSTVSAVGMWGTSEKEAMLQEVANLFQVVQELFERRVEEVMALVDGAVDKLELITTSAMPDDSEKCATEGSADNEPMQAVLAERQKASDMVEKLLETLQSEVLPEWVKLMSSAESAAKAQGLVLSQIRSVVPGADFQVDIPAFYELSMYTHDGLLVLMRILQSSRCFLDGQVAKLGYTKMLAQWSEWRQKSAEVQGELGLPTLEQIVMGARSVKDLRAWTQIKPTSCSSVVDELMQMLLNAPLLAHFDSLVRRQVASALSEVRLATRWPQPLLQDVDMLKRCADNQRLDECPSKMLTGDVVEGAPESLTAIAMRVKKMLETTAGELTLDMTWSAYPAVEMAKECLRLLGDPGNEDAKDLLKGVHL